MVKTQGRIAATAIAVAVSVFISTIGVPGGLAQPAAAAVPESPGSASPQERSIEGRPVPAALPVKGAEDTGSPPAPKEAVWPKAGVAEMALVGAEMSSAPGLPVKVGTEPPTGVLRGGQLIAEPAESKPAKRSSAATPTAAAPAKVRVETFDNAVAQRIGGVGVAFKVTRTDGGSKRAPVTVSVDYSSFRSAGRGGFASSLALVEQPACVLEAELTDDCRARAVRERRQLPVANDVAAGTLTASAQAGTGESVLMVAQTAAATDGTAAGSFAATDLNPSGTWQVGLSSGAFTYSYPITMPPAVAGEAPSLALSYSSSTVDGMNSKSNNQGSVAGVGWDLDLSFIEQGFSSCYDRCYQTGSSEDPYNTSLLDLTMSLSGKSAKIVKDTTSGNWKTDEDYGWKIEQIASSTESGKPYWKVTTQDGTSYRFGYRRDASLQNPFFSPEQGQPCHQHWVTPGQGHVTTVCTAPYRWMLDQVVDSSGNLTDYTYQRDTGQYCSRFRPWSNCMLSYDRSAILTSVSYGSNVNVPGSTPTARVLFGMSSRVIGDDNDLPDLESDCVPETDCGDSPLFYFDERLTSITTQVAAGAGWDDVTRYDLTHKWVWSPDLDRPLLWLDKIQQTGRAGSGPEISLPPVTFASVLMDNSLNWFDYGRSRLPRISSVDNELGGRTEVTYGMPSGCDLDTTSGPADQSAEGNDCYWTYEGQVWEGNTFVDAGTVWAKWVVTKTVEKDLVAGSPDMPTSYQYLGLVGWTQPWQKHVFFPREAGWTRYRGYPTVRVIKGSGTDPAGYSVTSTTFFRGMHGDRYMVQPPFFYGTRTNQVTDFEGNSFNDHDKLTGQPLQEQTLRVATMNGSTPATFAEEESVRYEYTITPTGNGPDAFDPSYVQQTKIVTRTKVPSGWRYTDQTTAYDSDNLPTRINDYGARGVATDNTCDSISYVKNTTASAWLIGLPAVEESRAGDNCTTGTLLERSVTLYDGATTEAANTPTKGNPTETRAYTNSSTYSTAKTGYDDYGRAVSSTDPLGKTTTTTYTPATGWPTGGVTVTNPLGHTATTWQAAWGGTVGTRDANGNDSNVDYDALGRTIAVWTPVQPKSGDVAAATFTYSNPVNASGAVNGPARTAASTLQTGTTYLTAYSYDDGLGRLRETQATSPAGGRIVTTTTYDERGFTATSGGPVHNTGAAGSGLLNPALTSLPQWTKSLVDGLGRTTATLQMTAASELRRTTKAYFGDRVETMPPVGGKTVTYTDAAGQMTKVEEWKDASTHYDTLYEYDLAGRLAKHTDASGNVRSYTYDMLGRSTAGHDPDSGDVEKGYDAAGRMMWATNGNGEKVSYLYDDLGRTTSTWAGEALIGTKLADWTYDTLAKGLPTSATRYVPATGGPTTIAADAFTRSASGGLGSADTGGVYSTVGMAASYAIDGNAAKLTMPATGANRRAYLSANTATTSDLTFTVSSDKTATGNGIYLWGTGRSVSGQGDYRGRARLLSNGSVVLSVTRVDNAQVETLLTAELTVPDLTYTAETPLKMRVKTSGTAPTTIQAKLWPASGTEPATWQVSATDTTAGLQTAGGVGFGSFLSGTATNAPVVATVDDFTAIDDSTPSGGGAYTDTVTGYDAMGRPTGSTLTIPASEGLLGGSYTFSTTYATDGQVATYSMPAAGGLPAEVVASTYNALGMANGLTSNFGGGFTYVTSTAYSPTALLTERQYGSAGKVRRNYTWNTATGWLDRVTTTNKADTATPQNVHDDQFFYNTGGDITRVLDAASAVPGQTSGQFECFGYDGLHRLTSAYTTTGATCSTTFDGLGVDPYNQAWTYDPVGNITSVTNQGQNSTYTYPGAGPTATRPNALTSITTPQGTNTYAYDDAGRLTARTAAGEDGTFSWNRLGQLEKVTIDGDDTTMVYNADGERLIRREPDGTATLYLGSMELSTSGGLVTGKRYYAAPDGETVAMRAAGADLTWLLSGQHSSSQLAINDTSSQVSRQRYLPYGQPRGADNLPGTDRGFLGKIEDASTGLDYLSARYYDPTIGKFISTDPLPGLVTAPQSFNPYSYAVNNPIGNADPTGLCSPDYCPQRAGNLDRLADKTKDKKLKKKAAAVNKRDSKRYQKHYQKRDSNWVKRGKDPKAQKADEKMTSEYKKWKAGTDYGDCKHCDRGHVVENDDIEQAASILPFFRVGKGALGTLFRSDTRHPDEIFKSGFDPRGDNMDLLEHVSGYSKDSGFVSTSENEAQTTRRGGNIYHIRGVKGRDVNKEFPGNPHAHEEELAVPGRVDPSCIVGCRLRDGTWVPNPNYGGK